MEVKKTVVERDSESSDSIDLSTISSTDLCFLFMIDAGASKDLGAKISRDTGDGCTSVY